MELQGKTVTVVGLAKSGVSAALLLKERGADVRATDAKPADALGDAFGTLENAGVKMFVGGHPDEAVAGADLVVTSPGVPWNSKPLAQARAEKIPLIGELELAWRLLPQSTSVVAITGSNGKSTTTTLTGHLLQSSGIDTWVGGNLGLPLSELVRGGSKPACAVVEVSSFMLETTDTFAPDIATILNVSPNHLDRHKDFEEYVSLKARIWKNASEDAYSVFNRDDAAVARAAANAPGRSLSFGSGDAPGVGGAGYRWSGDAGSVQVRLPGKTAEQYSLRDFPSPGAHNAANAAAAVLMARVAGASANAVPEALRTFRPLEHRLEACGVKNGVRFFNDSKATTTEAVTKSLEVFDRGVILLCGGKDKGGDWKGLAGVVRGRVKRLITFGTHRDLIADALGTAADETVRTPDLASAFAKATEAASNADVVLFSPGCASYDQFLNFEDRGRQFKALVQAYIAGSGGGAS